MEPSRVATRARAREMEDETAVRAVQAQPVAASKGTWSRGPGGGEASAEGT